MLHDRILCEVDQETGERRSTGGIVIPATAAMGARRLAWARVVAVGPHARSVQPDDHVLRERDVHAVASERLGDEATGLYL
jgi:chaperonin GroES